VASAVGGVGAPDHDLAVTVGGGLYRSVMAESRCRHSAGGVSSLGLHLVWCPKYRRRILGGRVAPRFDELLEQIAVENTWQVVAKEVMPDHVHLFVRVRPTDAPAEVVGRFEGRTARVLRQKFPWLAETRVLWSRSYFSGSVGYVSEARVRRCDGYQWGAVR
jgi:putative transposase